MRQQVRIHPEFGKSGGKSRFARAERDIQRLRRFFERNFRVIMQHDHFPAFMRQSAHRLPQLLLSLVSQSDRFGRVIRRSIRHLAEQRLPIEFAIMASRQIDGDPRKPRSDRFALAVLPVFAKRENERLLRQVVSQCFRLG